MEERAIAYVAKAADGSMRDALSLLDQCIAFYLGQKLTYDNVLEVLGAVDMDVFGSLFGKICAGNLTEIIRELEQIILQGRDLSQFVTDFIWYLRSLLLLKSDEDKGMENVLDVSGERLEQMKQEAALTDMDTLMRYIRVFSELSGQIRYASQKRVLVEIALIKLCKPSMERDYESVLQRIAQLERLAEEGTFSLPAGQAGAPLEDLEVKKKPAEKLKSEALPEDVQTFIGRFQEIRRKLGGMNSVILKDASLRELPEHTGVQIILSRDWPVDEQELSQAVEEMTEKMLNVHMKVQISIPGTDTRAEEPALDLSGLVGMPIELE